MIDEKQKNEELAKLQKIIEEVEDWGCGEIIISIQDGRIVLLKSNDDCRNPHLPIKELKTKFS